MLEEFILNNDQVISLPILFERTNILNNMPNNQDTEKGIYIVSKTDKRIYIGSTNGEINVMSDISEKHFPLIQQTIELGKQIISKNLTKKSNTILKILYKACTNLNDTTTIIYYNKKEIYSRNLSDIYTENQNKQNIKIVKYNTKTEFSNCIKYIQEEYKIKENFEKITKNLLSIQKPDFIEDNLSTKINHTKQNNPTNLIIGISKLLYNQTTLHKELYNKIQIEINQKHTRGNIYDNNKGIRYLFELESLDNKIILDEFFVGTDCFVNTDSNNILFELNIKDKNKGIIIEPKIYPQNQKNNEKCLLYISHDGTTQINQPKNTYEKNHIIIDTICNKIYIKKDKLTTKELHSQTMAVELLKYLLTKQGQPIFNSELPPSSYTKNKNLLNSKVIIPLKKIIKEKLGKEIPLFCNGGLNDFVIQLHSSDIKFGFIKKSE